MQLIFPCNPDSEQADDAQKKKDKEDLEEVSTELELADEDELVPYALSLLAVASSSFVF